MKINRNQIYFFAGLFLCLMIWNQNLSYQGKSYPLITKRSLYEEHNPIYINSNYNFETLGYSGSGTVTDPYLIENLNITDFTSDLIFIRDTTVYFTIQNCVLNGAYDMPGIFLHKVKHCTVFNNTINNSRIAIRLYASNENTFSNNSLYNNSAYGITLGDSNNDIISNNSIHNSNGNGIGLGTSHYNIISNNKVTHYLDGVGIELYNSSKNSITNNSVSYGIHGITLFAINNSANNISNNIISYNNGWGVHLNENASNTLVKGNNFIGNTGYPSQATDDGVNNIFNYNYWDDWTSPDNNGDGIVDLPYSIEGITTNQDLNPLISPYTQPFSTTTVDTSTTTTSTTSTVDTSTTSMETSSLTPLDPLSILVGISTFVIVRTNVRKRNRRNKK